MALTNRNGKRSTALISLNTSSSVNPIILNGSRINHIRGSRNSMTNAMGQQSTNKIHQRITANIVFMIIFQVKSIAKDTPN
jgi:hypothetical protein